MAASLRYITVVVAKVVQPVTKVCRLSTCSHFVKSELSTNRLFIIRRLATDSSSSDSETNHSTEHASSDKFEEQDHEIQQKILNASLPFVSSHGWTKKTLAAGAEVEGYPSVAHGMFPRGGVELIEFFYTSSNEELANSLKAEVDELKSKGEKPKTRPFIRNAIEKRLRMITPYIDQWPQAMAIQALPLNAVRSVKNLGQLVDDIWFYAGDNSVDFNWYTKRGSLAAVYKSTEIFMIQDRSEDRTDTWTFLDRRLDNLTKVASTLRNVNQYGDVVGEALTGIYIMGRNVLGINARKR